MALLQLQTDSEPITVGFPMAVLGSLPRLGSGLSMFDPMPASILLLVAGIAAGIGVLAAQPATVLLAAVAALAFHAPNEERSTS